MTAPQPPCEVTIIGPAGELLAQRAVTRPDLEGVDQIAWMALVARRIGGRLALGGVAPDLCALFELCGLQALLDGSARSVASVEVERQPEGGEEALGVEEGEEVVQGGDLPT